jgi:hypothetical protein
MNKIKLISGFILVGIVGLFVGRYFTKPKEKIKEVVKIVEVEKIVKVETKKTTTRIRETVRKDGTKETETVIVEDSTKKESETKENKLEASKEITKGFGVTLGLLALKDIDRFSEKTHVGAIAAVPLIGNIKILSSIDTSRRFGIGLALEF